jgi:4-carboxymuconolactone decarboxylase
MATDNLPVKKEDDASHRGSGPYIPAGGSVMSAPESRSAAERRKTGLRVLHRLSGNEEQGPDEMAQQIGRPLAEAVIDFCLGELWERPHLDLRTRSLILIGALTALGDHRALRAHVSGALAHGASEDEIREVFVLMSGYAGFPRATSAAEVAESVLQGCR